jgi:phage-related minor tail protein
MAQETYAAALQSMIDRAGSLSAEQVDALGKLWESDEELEMPWPSMAAELQGEVNPPVITNQALIDAWRRALDAAGTAGRVDEIEAARAAGRAAHHDDRHLDDSPSSKNGTEEAVRSAVLAVGVRDLISDADYQVLVAPWQQVLGVI